MDYTAESFRWGLEHLHEDNIQWAELTNVLSSVTEADILAEKLRTFEDWTIGKKTPPVGGQKILNDIIERRLLALDWKKQIYCLGDIKDETGKRKKDFTYWTMDFQKGDIGIEVSFNNAGVLAQNVLRLSVMSENPYRPKEELIRLGILVCAHADLKSWSGMDSTVLTQESVVRVLPVMNFNIPTPIIVVGLHPSSDGTMWDETDFFSHKKLAKWEDLSPKNRRDWSSRIEDFRKAIDEMSDKTSRQ